MIPIDVIRSAPDVVESSLRKRGDENKILLLQEIIKKDGQWKSLLSNLDSLRNKRNILTKKVDEVRKSGGDFKPVVEEAKAVSNEIKQGEGEVESLRSWLDSNLLKMPNILHDSVPYGKSDADNVVVRNWGDAKADT